MHLVDEGDPKGWSTMLVTALCSWGKPPPPRPSSCGQRMRPQRVVYGASHRAGQRLGDIGPPRSYLVDKVLAVFVCERLRGADDLVEVIPGR
jgi:hypothetical protein